MICVGGDHETRVITQGDHARFAGELLSLWRRDEVLEHRRRKELLRAARQHDNGWQESDAAPHLHPDGDRPHDFLSIPSSVRYEIWERGTSRYEEEAPYVALLITEHALQLLRKPTRALGRELEAWRETVTALEDRRVRLLETSGTAEEDLSRDYVWIELTDFLSLVVCNAWDGDFSRHGIEGDWRGGSLRLAPFPLAGSTTFEIPSRRLPRRRFDGDADLAVELAAARWERTRVSVQPLDEA